MKKILSAALACALAVTGSAVLFSGCNNTRDENTLEIRYYVGGFGSEWMDAAADAFEAANPGVTVNPIPDNEVTGSIRTYLESGKQLSDLYFTQSFNWQQYVSQGLIEPLDDLYTQMPIEKTDGTTTTLYEFMSEDRRDVSHITARPGEGTAHYWMVPWSVQNCGMVYNEDIVLNTPRRSTGQNWDHAPTTMSELYEYVDDLNASTLTAEDGTKVVAFAFGIQSGQWWLTFPLKVWWAQYQGVYETSEAARNDGHGADATTSDPDEAVYDSYYDFWDFGAPDYDVEEFTKEGGTNVWNQKGIQVALDTLASLITDGNGNYINCLNRANQISGIDAEREFANGKAAFIFVGNWVENEVGVYLEEGETLPIKAMPVPFLDSSAHNAKGNNLGVSAAVNPEDNEPYLINNNAEMDIIFIPSAAPNKELAKEFLAFIHSEEMLLQFTMETGVMRPFDYDPMDAEEMYDFTFSDFAKSSFDLYDNADFNITEYPMNMGHVAEDERDGYTSLIYTYIRPELFQGIGSGTCLNGILTKTGAEIMADVVSETNRRYSVWVNQVHL